MHDILLVFGSLQILGLIATSTLGLMSPSVPVSWHLYSGVFTGMFTIAMQALIFVYLLGTGKSVKIAIREHGVDPEYHHLSRQFKFDCYPISMLAALAVITTVFCGGGALTSVIPPWIHGIMAAVTILVVLFALMTQLDRVSKNQRLLEQLKSDLKTEVPEPTDEPLPDLTPNDEDRQRIFNCFFMAVMCWLPYLYLHHIVSLEWVRSEWFLAISAVSTILGFFRLSRLRPRASRTSVG